MENGISNHSKALNNMLINKIKKDIKTLKQLGATTKEQYIPHDSRIY